MSQVNTKCIAEYNDRFRAGDHAIPGRWVVTAGLSDLVAEGLAGADMPALFAAVQGFSVFTEDNDPHHEHDFGAFDFAGQRCFWKIDLYDANYAYGTEDASDLTVTRRVLTIMLASEY